MKIMTATNVSYRSEMYQVITRTFFTSPCPLVPSPFSVPSDVSCKHYDHSRCFFGFAHTHFFPLPHFRSRDKMLIDSTCLFTVKVSIYHTKKFPLPSHSIYPVIWARWTLRAHRKYVTLQTCTYRHSHWTQIFVQLVISNMCFHYSCCGSLYVSCWELISERNEAFLSRWSNLVRIKNNVFKLKLRFILLWVF